MAVDVDSKLALRVDVALVVDSAGAVNSVVGAVHVRVVRVTVADKKAVDERTAVDKRAVEDKFWVLVWAGMLCVVVSN